MPPIQNIQEEIKQGSKQAFKTLFHEYYTLLCSISYQYVKDTLASESIAEDTLYTLWQRRAELLPLSSLRGWLMRSVRNRSNGCAEGCACDYSRRIPLFLFFY